jgi:multiple sugar transport system ATP-binding protein
MNFVASGLREVESGLQLQIGSQELLVPREVVSQRPALRSYAGREVVVGIRPQDFEDPRFAPDTALAAQLKVHVDIVEYLGTETLVHFKVDAPPVITEETRDLAEDVAAEVDILEGDARQRQTAFVAVLDPRSSVSDGDDLALVLDVGRLHFFDPDTGLEISDTRGGDERA